MLHRVTSSRGIVTGCLAVVLILLALVGCREKSTVTFQGYVEGEFVALASADSGQLDRLLVTRGEQVPAGAPLFVLEAKNEAAALRQAEEQLNGAQAQLKDLLTGRRRQELEVISAQLAQATAKRKASSASLTRTESLFTAGVVSQSQLDDIRATAEADTGREDELKGGLVVARLTAREEQIKAQSAAVAAARATLDQAAWRLGQKAVTATTAALVFDTLYREGEWVPAGVPVVRLLPPGNIKVRFFVSEPLLGSLSPGKSVAFRTDGMQGEIPGRVTYLSTQAEYTPPLIYSNETRAKLLFMVEARPTTTSFTLHPGQPVTVRLP
jgi:HlyD family secretion protein